MTLEEYLKEHGIEAATFSRKIGLKGKKSIYRYMSGERKPRSDIMDNIIRVTGGAVMPNDFYSEQGCANTLALNK